MTYNRNQYLLHRQAPVQQLSDAQLQAQANALAAFHKRAQRAAMWRRLQILAYTLGAIATGVALFYSATN